MFFDDLDIGYKATSNWLSKRKRKEKYNNQQTILFRKYLLPKPKKRLTYFPFLLKTMLEFVQNTKARGFSVESVHNKKYLLKCGRE